MIKESKERKKCNKFENCLARASKLDRSKYSQSYIKTDGAKQFKRRLLGLCGKNTIKTLDELAEIMEEMHIVNSKDEAKEFIGILWLANPLYTHSVLEPSYLSFNLDYTRGKCEIIAYKQDSLPNLEY